MIAAIGAVALLSVLSAAALAATNGDLHLTQRDLDRKAAFAAAQAGIADFSFHLNNDNSYWAECTKVPDAERDERRRRDHQSPNAVGRWRIRDRIAAGGGVRQMRPK